MLPCRYRYRKIAVRFRVRNLPHRPYIARRGHTADMWDCANRSTKDNVLREAHPTRENVRGSVRRSFSYNSFYSSRANRLQQRVGVLKNLVLKIEASTEI